MKIVRTIFKNTPEECEQIRRWLAKYDPPPFLSFILSGADDAPIRFDLYASLSGRQDGSERPVAVYERQEGHWVRTDTRVVDVAKVTIKKVSPHEWKALEAEGLATPPITFPAVTAQEMTIVSASTPFGEVVFDPPVKAASTPFEKAEGYDFDTGAPVAPPKPLTLAERLKLKGVK